MEESCKKKNLEKKKKDFWDLFWGKPKSSTVWLSYWFFSIIFNYYYYLSLLFNNFEFHSQPTCFNYLHP